MVGCRAPNTLHAFFLLIVYFFCWNVQGQNLGPYDSDSGLLRTKRGVAKGSQTKSGRSVHPCLQRVDTTMFRGRIAILRLGCGPRLSNSLPRRISGRKWELSNVLLAPD